MECFIPTSKKQHSPPKLTEKTYSNSQNVSWNCIRVLCFLSFIFPIYNLMWCLIPACAILCWLLYLLYFSICLNVWYVVWHIFRFVCQLNWQILKNKQTQTNKKKQNKPTEKHQINKKITKINSGWSREEKGVYRVELKYLTETYMLTCRDWKGCV